MHLVKVAELQALEDAFRSAFIDELQKIAEANHGHTPWQGELEKFASSELLDEMVKEAIGQFLKAQSAGRLLEGAA